MKLMEQLDSAQRAIQDMDPLKASDILLGIDNSGALTEFPNRNAEVASKLRAIADLAQAARDGILAAKQQLAELSRLTQTLGTYDSSGNIQVQTLHVGTVKRF